MPYHDVIYESVDPIEGDYNRFERAVDDFARYHDVMCELADLIESDFNYYNRFERAINDLAQYQLDEFAGLKSLEDWILFCDELLTWVPYEKDGAEYLDEKMSTFYLVFNHELIKPLMAILTPWMLRYIKELEKFLDSPASLTSASLNSFWLSPNYKINEYMEDPGGWKTFNQFFARHIKPGYRPVSEDEYSIVSVTDSNFRGWWPIDRQDKITVKNIQWSIIELFNNSPYADYFRGGVFMHAYLKAGDYHRLHTPLAGYVFHAEVIQGAVALNTNIIYNTKTKKYQVEYKRIETVDPVGYQFSQTRGLCIIETVHGYIALIPVGMGFVSSVIITAEVGVYLRKGEEFGYFQFGGSDYILVFEEKIRSHITAMVDTHYNQGTIIGYIRPNFT